MKCFSLLCCACFYKYHGCGDIDVGVLCILRILPKLRGVFSFPTHIYPWIGNYMSIVVAVLSDNVHYHHVLDCACEVFV